MELGYTTLRRVIFIFGCSGHGSRDGDVSVSLLGHSNKNTTGGRSKRSMWMWAVATLKAHFLMGGGVSFSPRLF